MKINLDVSIPIRQVLTGADVIFLRIFQTSTFHLKLFFHLFYFRFKYV